MDGTTEFIIIRLLLTSLQSMFYLGKECKLQIKPSVILSNLTVWPKKYCKVWQTGRVMCASHGGVRNAAHPGSSHRTQLGNCTQRGETRGFEGRR